MATSRHPPPPAPQKTPASPPPAPLRPAPKAIPEGPDNLKARDEAFRKRRRGPGG